MTTFEGKMEGSGVRIGVAVSRWNELITKELLSGALETLKSAGVTDVVVAKVPGAWEIPLAAKALIGSGCQAVVALGCILQGQTPHAQQLGAEVGSALMSLQVESGVPIAWGVLTPNTVEEALERAGLKLGNKGREAAGAAVEMLSLLAQIKKA